MISAEFDVIDSLYLTFQRSTPCMHALIFRGVTLLPEVVNGLLYKCRNVSVRLLISIFLR
jgi:hypothetical protein